MHVAVLSPYSLDVPGGVGIHAMGEAKWLAEQGHRVTLVAPGTRYEGTRVGVELMLVGAPVGLRFNGSVARLALRRSQAREAIAAIQGADVVHVHEPLTPGIAFAAARAADRLLVTHHASFSVNRAMELVLWRRARALGDYDAIAVSRAAQRTINAATGRSVDVIPNAIRLPGPPEGGDGGWRGGAKPRVAFIGRAAEPRKGFGDFQALASRCSDRAEFIAIGPDTEQASVPVQGIGHVSETRRSDLLHSCDILVAPNRGGESFGLVLAEALAAGCSVAATALPGFRETLGDAMTEGVAELFPVGDVDKAALALTTLFETGPRPLVAYRHAARWSWDAVGPQILARLQALATHQ